MHRDDELAISQSEMRFAVFNIKFAQGNSAMTLCTGNVDFSTKNEQGGRKIAGEGGVTALSLRGNMANIPAVLETISICLPPPFALIVVNAAGIEAQIAADAARIENGEQSRSWLPEYRVSACAEETGNRRRGGVFGRQ